VSKSVLIGDFLRRIKRPIDLDPSTRYKLVTVKLKHKGVVLREEKIGANIKSKMYQVREGDFILSGIDARNGAFGIVPPELDGAVVTNDFWYFEIDDEVVDKDFFLELTATHWFDEICRKGSDGTTQRIRLQKAKFFSQRIHLPDLEEQKLFNKKFQAVRALEAQIKQSQTYAEGLMQAVLREAFSQNDQSEETQVKPEASAHA
jgi:restriction endonuclease S subunit